MKLDMKSGRITPLVLTVCLAVLSVAASIDDFKGDDIRTRRIAERRVRPMGPVSSSSTLKALEDCDEARAYLTEVAIETEMSFEDLIRYYTIELVGAGYVVQRSAGTGSEWEIDFRTGDLLGTVVIRPGEDGRSTALLRLNTA